jgi:hypothetical protein
MTTTSKTPQARKATRSPRKDQLKVEWRLTRRCKREPAQGFAQGFFCNEINSARIAQAFPQAFYFDARVSERKHASTPGGFLVKNPSACGVREPQIRTSHLEPDQPGVTVSPQEGRTTNEAG